MDKVVIADLQRELQQVKRELKETQSSLAFWETNGVLLTDLEKQYFYQRYRKEWRERRVKEQAEAAAKLKEMAVYFEDCRTPLGGIHHEKGV
ncbi:hypothetical protein [Lachnoclostridium edouardi]|uniref:hypothetical protein n=1 Tax=Lachnoclostridium edouardi TaxID=1926283 RepID=UPI000C7C0885|nr:hypothetical protein [Lachnoclostridium edouardi]